MKRIARVARCYTDQVLAANSEFVLDKRSSHHLSTVLRAREGQCVELFNGDGQNYAGTITSTGKKTTVNVTGAEHNTLESSLHITLIQAVARGDKMDAIVQKATELGVSAIQPVYSKHAISKLDATREVKKQAHWLSVAISACEQCGRSTVPVVSPVVTLNHYLDNCSAPATNEQRWVLSPTAQPPGTKTEDITCVSILIGPESGLDEDEVQAAATALFSPLQLGPRILRTETAGPASIAILQARFGDMN